MLKGLITGEEFTALDKGESLPEYDPASEENFEYNKPSWFTFAYRTADGRIYGYNFSGAFGELKLAYVVNVVQWNLDMEQEDMILELIVVELLDYGL